MAKRNLQESQSKMKELFDKEVQYMLKNDITEESQSNWSSPCILVPKMTAESDFIQILGKSMIKQGPILFPSLGSKIAKIKLAMPNLSSRLIC